jgi:hypothetical protein
MTVVEYQIDVPTRFSRTLKPDDYPDVRIVADDAAAGLTLSKFERFPSGILLLKYSVDR